MHGNVFYISVYSLSNSSQIFELLTGNYLFDPQKGSRFNRDDGKKKKDIDNISKITYLYKI